MKKSTRRDFLKNSTLGTLGVFSSLNSTFAQSFFESFINFDTSNKPFLIDVIRYSDLLHLKLHLYNVSKDNRDNLIPKKDFYMFVQLPSQHIAEELITELTKEQLKEQLGERKKSFLAGSSWLVLKHIEKEKSPKIKLTESYLLDWANNFELVTLDHLKNSKGSFSELNLREKRELLCEIKKKTVINKDNPLMFNAQEIGNQYFSSFEVPYKMYLSPISEAIEGYKFERHTGRHTFFSNKLKPLLKTQEGPNFYSLHRVWENQLHFQAIDGNNYAPRFKVVEYEDQKAIDNDIENDNGTKIELLPKPIHRRELSELTMLPFNKRDVVSDFFKISALGVSTKLKYENEQPIENTTIVSWKQHIKYARDNYVSITFRAIDVFTGLKLLVSIVAERKFQDGKSFLLQRYFISYLEPEKEFEDSLAIGKMTFKKIIALSKGEFFSPVSININSNSSYHVQKEDLSKKCEKEELNFEPKNDLEFKYIGVDKKGKEHEFTSKIIFIPAESYQVKTGSYEYKCDEDNTFTYTYNNPPEINIRHIGSLNPYCKVASNPNDEHCFEKRKCEEEYTYSIIRNFEKKDKVEVILGEIINKINTYATKGLKGHYSIKINNEVTFADISSLQIEVDGKYLVNPKSDNSTFKTRNIFLFTTQPEEELKPEKIVEDYNELDCCGKDVTNDPFSAKHPLIPFLHHAEVVIPQISQIEGKDVFRTVALADSFWSRQLNVKPQDFSHKSNNKFQLLFKLVSGDLKIEKNPKNITRVPIKSFFSDNYKSSGGVANPGIAIKNISVLDNGITFSEDHNKDPQNGDEKRAEVSVETSINTNSIFEALEAEICGINLLEIVETVLPIDDLPVFNFIKDADEAFNKTKEAFKSLQSIYNKWEKEYEAIKIKKTELENELQKLSDKLKDDAQKELRGQINTLIEQSNLLSKLEAAIEQIQSSIPDANAVEDKYLELENKITQHIDITFINSFNTELENLNLVDFYPKYLTEAEETELNKKFNSLSEKVKAIVKNLKTVIDINDFIDYFFLRVLFKILDESKGKDFTIISGYEDKLYLEILIQKVKELKYDIELEASQLTTEIKKQWGENYQAIVIGLEKATKYCQILKQIEIKRVQDEIKRKQKKIIEQYSKKLEETINIKTEKLSPYFDNIKQIDSYIKKYEFYRSAFNSFNEDFKSLESTLNSKKIKDLLLEDLKQTISSFENQKIKDELYKIFNLIDNSKDDIFKEYNLFLEKYNNIIDEIFYDATEGALVIFKYEQKFNKELEKAKIEAKKIQLQVKVKENEIKGFFDKKKKELDTEFQRQLEILKNDPRNIEAQNFIKEIKAFKQKLQEASNQKLNYTFDTKKFKNANLGVISFAANKNTELSVKVDYSMQFDISSFDNPPTLSKQSYITDTTFSDFQISFLKLISIDFDKVKFISGSDVKDDFQVKIRDIQFEGCLSFVDAIQEYLNGLSNNLIFEVNSSGAMVNYILPPFTIEAPPFKFFNISFSALLILPFDPQKSLQLKFGLGSQLNKFGLIYGAFGGQGYFNIIVEPKQGVVGLEVVLEFGAIYYADIGGVAKGVAFLVGGIYIKRYYGKYQIKAYILCVGRFSILGIFSASASFYLGLEGDGNRLDGVCVITFTKRFSRFFKIKVKASMRKTIYGTNKNKSRKAIEDKLESLGYKLVDTNIFEELVEGEFPFIVLSYREGKTSLVTDGLINDFESVPREEDHQKSTCKIAEYRLTEISKPIDSLTIGNEKITLKESIKEDLIKPEKTKRQLDKEYFKSLYYEYN